MTSGNSKKKYKEIIFLVSLLKFCIMGRPAEEKKYFTVEEYLQFEEVSETRHEFYKNELFPIESTTRRHNSIVNNIMIAMRPTFRNKGCDVFTEAVKVEVLKNVYYPYPDLVLTCDPDDTHQQMVKSPILIVEVESPSTTQHDHSFKWSQYRKIPSLRYYMMVAQDEISIELYSRNSNISIWTYQEFTSLDDVLYFEVIDFHLDVKTIYEMIEFKD
jgi:Uma2 family endonuclease